MDRYEALTTMQYTRISRYKKILSITCDLEEEASNNYYHKYELDSQAEAN